MDASQVRELLASFGVTVAEPQAGQILAYLDLLLRWNRKINLTSVTRPEEVITRHFGESLHLSAQTELRGALLDIGSGAGFPGLALKIAFPELAVTLLEPVARKRAFLKEVVRQCGMTSVEVRAERAEDFAPTLEHRAFRPPHSAPFDAVSARAVGSFATLLPAAARCLKAEGRIFMWITSRQAGELRASSRAIAWDAPWALPLSRDREIWRGRLAPPSAR